MRLFLDKSGNGRTETAALIHHYFAFHPTEPLFRTYSTLARIYCGNLRDWWSGFLTGRMLFVSQLAASLKETH